VNHAANDLRAIVRAGQQRFMLLKAPEQAASMACRRCTRWKYCLSLLPSFVWLAPESRESEQRSWPWAHGRGLMWLGFVLRGVVV